MALFNFRWPGQKEATSDAAPMRRSRMAQTENVEDLRRRARQRLMGAAVLVVLGVIGFPMLFDSQPRPIAVNVPIEIPDRDEVAPLMVPGTPAPVSAPAPEPAWAASNGPAPLSIPRPPEPPRLLPEPAAVPVPAPTPSAAWTEPAPAAVPVSPPAVAVPSSPAPAPAPEAPKPAPKPQVNEAERARALLEGRAPVAQSAPAAVQQAARFIVQVGAFADASKAQEVRNRLERAGLKTYAQVVDTADGKRTRVRVGPFEQRADADATAARIKTLGLAASVLTL